MQNEGALDRGIRFIIGCCLLAAALMSPFASHQQVFLGLGAGVVYLTAAVGFCPLYKLIRLNTTRHQPA